MALLAVNVAAFPESLVVQETVQALSLTQCVTLGNIRSSRFYICRKTWVRKFKFRAWVLGALLLGMWAHLQMFFPLSS